MNILQKTIKNKSLTFSLVHLLIIKTNQGLGQMSEFWMVDSKESTYNTFHPELLAEMKRSRVVVPLFGRKILGKKWRTKHTFKLAKSECESLTSHTGGRDLIKTSDTEVCGVLGLKENKPMCVSLDQVKDFSNNPQNIRKHSLQESRLYTTAHF